MYANPSVYFENKSCVADFPPSDSICPSNPIEFECSVEGNSALNIQNATHPKHVSALERSVLSPYENGKTSGLSEIDVSKDSCKR